MTEYTDPIAEPWWLYRARCEHVVDGDTIDILADQGMRVYRSVRVRLANVDTAEIYGTKSDSEEHITGQEHREFVMAWLFDANAEWSGDWPLVVATAKDERGKYGRLVARIQRRVDGEVLNERLREEFDVGTDA